MPKSIQEHFQSLGYVETGESTENAWKARNGLDSVEVELLTFGSIASLTLRVLKDYQCRDGVIQNWDHSLHVLYTTEGIEGVPKVYNFDGLLILGSLRDTVPESQQAWLDDFIMSQASRVI